MNKKYLLDTNICIYLFRGKHDIAKCIMQIGAENCYISEITIAELMFGAENSKNPERHYDEIKRLQENVKIIRMLETLPEYAKIKKELRTAGTPIEDFDILIGAAARANNMILVTENIKHLGKISNLETENWVTNNIK